MKRACIPRAAAALAVTALICTAVPALAQAPLKVGDHHALAIDSARASRHEVFRTERSIVYEISHAGATYVALHFSRFDLAPGERLIVSDPRGGQSYVLEGRGKMEAGEFWAQHVKGNTVVLEYVTAGRRSGRGFAIDEYVAGTVALGGPPPEAICGTDDKENAVCYQGSNPTEYGRARAVARLLIQGSSLCTGWLASANNHLVTNEHCITTASAALNTDYEFAAEAPNCNDANCQLCWPGVVFSGATFIQDSAALDYALVQITSGNPAATYGFLEIDNRAAVLDETIYIPQHPGGRAKELGIASSHAQDPGGVCRVNSTSEPPCSGSGYNDVGYYCDTEGGSSGSPVLATSSHKVIALHHCRGSLTCTQTGADPNRGVPITLVCAEICGIINPGDPCGNGVCEAGEDCNTCPADCEISGGAAACGNGLCEAGNGETCLTCPADCNGKTNGNPNNRFCCGFGDGLAPNGCGDNRCTSSGFSCTETPVGGGTFCCGDGTCDPAGENCGNCALDCTGPAEICTGGVDDDCDGDVDCSDSECTSDPACQCLPGGSSCTANNQCCSNKCKGGTCRGN